MFDFLATSSVCCVAVWEGLNDEPCDIRNKRCCLTFSPRAPCKGKDWVMRCVVLGKGDRVYPFLRKLPVRWWSAGGKLCDALWGSRKRISSFNFSPWIPWEWSKGECQFALGYLSSPFSCGLKKEVSGLISRNLALVLLVFLWCQRLVGVVAVRPLLGEKKRQRKSGGTRNN